MFPCFITLVFFIPFVKSEFLESFVNDNFSKVYSYNLSYSCGVSGDYWVFGSLFCFLTAYLCPGIHVNNIRASFVVSDCSFVSCESIVSSGAFYLSLLDKSRLINERVCIFSCLTMSDNFPSAYYFNSVGEITGIISMGSVFNCGKLPNKGLMIFRIETINIMHSYNSSFQFNRGYSGIYSVSNNLSIISSTFFYNNLSENSIFYFAGLNISISYTNIV